MISENYLSKIEWITAYIPAIELPGTSATLWTPCFIPEIIKIGCTSSDFLRTKAYNILARD